MKALALRFLFITSLTVVLAASSPASAQLADLDGLGELSGLPSLGALVKEALAGRVPEGVQVEKLDNGMVKITVPLPEHQRTPRQKRAKDLINTAITVEIVPPTGDQQLLTFDFAPVADVTYYLGWVVFNLGNQNITANSSIKTKGPGPDFNSGNFSQLYEARSFILLAGEMTDGFRPGLHSVDAKVRGAKPGKIKGNFCVDLAC